MTPQTKRRQIRKIIEKWQNENGVNLNADNIVSLATSIQLITNNQALLNQGIKEWFDNNNIVHQVNTEVLANNIFSETRHPEILPKVKSLNNKSRKTRNSAKPNDNPAKPKVNSQKPVDKQKYQRIDYYEYIISPEWKLKADEAKKKAGNRCQLCNRPKGEVTLVAHHRTYKRLGRELPEDITVLCKECHELFEMSSKNRPRDASKRRVK